MYDNSIQSTVPQHSTESYCVRAFSVTKGIATSALEKANALNQQFQPVFTKEDCNILPKLGKNQAEADTGPELINELPLHIHKSSPVQTISLTFSYLSSLHRNSVQSLKSHL